MYCAKCGNKTELEHRFCGGCGAPIELPIQTTVDQWAILKAKVSKVQINKKTKIITSLVIAVIGAGAIGYSIAHYTNGPATPDALEAKLMKAVSERNVDELVKYLDASQSDLKQGDVIETLKQAFDEETVDAYTNYFQQASIEAEASLESIDSKNSKNNMSLLQTRINPFQYVSHKSWRGTKWSFSAHLSDVSFQQKDGWKLNATIGTINNTTGRISGLWPAVYEYSVAISNEYGGSEDITGTVDLMTKGSQNIHLDSQVKSHVSLVVPAFKEMTFKLNGVDLSQSQDKAQIVDITPVPKELKVQAIGTYLGKPIDETTTLDLTKSGNNDLSVVMKKGIAQHALELLFNSNQSWVNAHNTGDIQLLTGYNPNEWTYRQLSNNLTKPADKKLELLRFAVEPSSLSLSDKQITIKTSEEYSTEGVPELNIANNQYTIMKMPDKDEWWITSMGQNYFGENLLTKSTSLKKERSAIASEVVSSDTVATKENP